MEQKRVKPLYLFQQIDKDESGSITPNELRQGLFNLCQITLTDPEFKTVLKTVDKDHSGALDYREFSRAIKYGNPDRKTNMKRLKTKMKTMEHQNKDKGREPTVFKKTQPAPKTQTPKTKKTTTTAAAPAAAYQYSPKSPKSPKSPSTLSTFTSSSSVFKQPTGIPFIDRAGTVAQHSYQQALLVPSRVRRKSNRARAQLFKDFDLMANTEALAVQHSTHELACRASLQNSGFKMSPTGRTVDPELLGADTVLAAEHVRAEKTRRSANRAKEADEQWKEWKIEKSRGIELKKEKQKRIQDNKVRALKAKEEIGKVAYVAWQRKKKSDLKKKKIQMKLNQTKMEQEALMVENMIQKKKEDKKKEREKQTKILEKQMLSAMGDR